MGEGATNDGRPLGYCLVCVRVRWLGRVDEELSAQRGFPHGVCSGCVQEEEAATP